MQTVMVVDDDPAILGFVSDLLEAEGYFVESASDGKQALEVVRKGKPDVILLDLMMPVMDGWTFTRELRKLPDYRDIPIVLVSAHKELSAVAQEVGASGYLNKPFDLDSLLETVEKQAGEHV